MHQACGRTGVLDHTRAVVRWARSMAEAATGSGHANRYNTHMAAGTPRILVVQNDPDKSLGAIAAALEAAGADLDVRFSTNELPGLDDFHGLVVLPGLADPVDDTQPVHRARAAIGDACDRGLPVLGLCLGAHLVAQVTGGAVFPSAVEVGYADVDATPDAADDPLLNAAPARFSAFHAHAYAFSPPPGAAVLARNDVCVQAIRLEPRIWAIQFHPETTVEWVTQMAAAVSDPDRSSGIPARTASFFRSNGLDPQIVVAAAQQAAVTAATIATQIAVGFGSVCRAMASRGATNR
jgi:GMP synthase (glutamine-hydrolysing)